MSSTIPDSLESLLKSSHMNVVVSERLFGNEFVTLHYDNSMGEWVVMCFGVRISHRDINVAIGEFCYMNQRFGP